MRYRYTALLVVAAGALLAGCAPRPQPGCLEIRLASDEKRPGYGEVNVAGIPDPIYISPIVELTEANVTKAEVRMAVSNPTITVAGDPSKVSKEALKSIELGAALGIRFGFFSMRKLSRLTEENTGERLAVVLLGQVIYAPVITGRIEGGLLIHGSMAGDLKKEDLQYMADVLNGKIHPDGE